MLVSLFRPDRNRFTSAENRLHRRGSLGVVMRHSWYWGLQYELLYKSDGRRLRFRNRCGRVAPCKSVPATRLRRTPTTPNVVMTKHYFGGLARFCAVLTTALLAVPCSAQISVGLVDGPSTSASRGDLGKGAGTLLTGLHTSHWRSIGDGGKASDGAKSCKVKGFRTVLRDQDSSTQETYRWVVRSGTDANGPTAGAAGRCCAGARGPGCARPRLA